MCCSAYIISSWAICAIYLHISLRTACLEKQQSCHWNKSNNKIIDAWLFVKTNVTNYQYKSKNVSVEIYKNDICLPEISQRQRNIPWTLGW